MASGIGRRIEERMERRALRHWEKLAADVERMDLGTLKGARHQAMSLKRRLDSVIHEADARLTLPRIGSSAIQRPVGTDWAYRPELWRGPLALQGRSSVESKTPIGNEAVVFHDCRYSELTYRQVRNTREEDLAPFGLRLDVFGFDGSFLSLVLHLPPESIAGLKSRHVITLSPIVEQERHLEIFARLNIKHGPNTEQLVRELPMREVDKTVEFDLAYSKLNEKRVERMWLDLIFEEPQMNQITIRDLTLTRRPRADL